VKAPAIRPLLNKWHSHTKSHNVIFSMNEHCVIL